MNTIPSYFTKAWVKIVIIIHASLNIVYSLPVAVILTIDFELRVDQTDTSRCLTVTSGDFTLNCEVKRKNSEPVHWTDQYVTLIHIENAVQNISVKNLWPID